MGTLPQRIPTRQHIPTLRSISLRICSRHTATAAESASGLETTSMVVIVETTAATAGITEVTVGITEEITAVMAGTTAVMEDIQEVTVATTADTVAITESMKHQQFIPSG